MSTWNTVIIYDATIDLDTLPDLDDWGIWDGTNWDRITPMTVQTDAAGKILRDENNIMLMTEGEPYTVATGRSKYSADEIPDWATEWSAAHPGVTVEWGQEWDDDDSGKSLDVWRDGERVRAESKHDELVPDNLDDLVKAVREAFVEHDRGRGKCVCDAEPLQAAARALIDALRPQEVKS